MRDLPLDDADDKNQREEAEQDGKPPVAAKKSAKVDARKRAKG